MNYLNHKGRRRVVITATGVISPIGNNSEAYWRGLKNGANGAAPISAFDASEFKCTLAAEVKNFNPEDYFSRKEVRRLDRSTQFALAAVKEAIESSGLKLEDYDPFRMGVILGTGIGGYITMETEIGKYFDKGEKVISPLYIPMFISNMTSGRVAMEYPIYGVNYAIATACASSTNAIGEAFQKITNGYLDICVTGGFEAPIRPSAIGGFVNMTALTTQTDPELASRPFDRDRDGFLSGEGAGILILESLESAVQRGAKIIAEITGYGATADGYHITSPHPEGRGDSRALLMAIEDAGHKPEEIDYINAHGTSTPLNDKYETIAIKQALGARAYEIPITSIKGNTGHLMGAAGAIEAIATAFILRDGVIPPIRGLVNKAEECDLDYVYGQARPSDARVALSNSLGFGGQNGVICLEKYEETL